MKPNPFLLIPLCVAGLAMAPTESALAEREDRAASVGPEVAENPDPSYTRREFFGAVIQVSPTERVLTVRDQSLGIQTLQGDARTTIRMGDKSANWSDLKIGVMVDGICVGAPGNGYAESINIGR